MKYILDNKSDSIKKITKNEIKGLEIKSNNSNVIGAKKITVVDEELKSIYIKQNLNKKISVILGKMQFILESDDDGSDAAHVLDEIQRLKGIIINKYREHLKSAEYKAFLQKLILLEEEFRKKYTIKQIYKEMMMENFNESQSKGR